MEMGAKLTNFSSDRAVKAQSQTVTLNELLRATHDSLERIVAVSFPVEHHYSEEASAPSQRF